MKNAINKCMRDFMVIENIGKKLMQILWCKNAISVFPRERLATVFVITTSCHSAGNDMFLLEDDA